MQAGSKNKWLKDITMITVAIDLAASTAFSTYFLNDPHTLKVDG